MVRGQKEVLEAAIQDTPDLLSKKIAIEGEKKHIERSNNDPRLSADFPGLRGISRVVVAL